MSCTLCGSQGTTCPLNIEAQQTRPIMHASCKKFEIYCSLMSYKHLCHFKYVLDQYITDADADDADADADADAYECPVCLNTVHNYQSLACTHVLCISCTSRISVQGSIKCPICRNVSPIRVKVLPEQKQQIIDIFNEVLSVWDQVRGDRQNFINLQFLLSKICDKLGIPNSMYVRCNNSSDILWDKISVACGW